MALNKLALQKLLNNPGMFSAEDMEEDELEVPMELEDEEALVPEEMLESPINESMDEEGLELSPEAPEVDELGIEDEEAMLASVQPQTEEVDADLLSKLRRLKSGESIEEMPEEEAQDVVGDMEAPMDLRKKALQKIKQRYLGQ